MCSSASKSLLAIQLMVSRWLVYAGILSVCINCLTQEKTRPKHISAAAALFFFFSIQRLTRTAGHWKEKKRENHWTRNVMSARVFSAAGGMQRDQQRLAAELISLFFGRQEKKKRSGCDSTPNLDFFRFSESFFVSCWTWCSQALWKYDGGDQNWKLDL